MTESTTATKQIYGLMAAAMADVGAIAKGRRNQQQGYNFRGIDDVYNTIHPVMVRHGIFCTPRVVSSTQTERKTRQGGLLIYTTVQMEFTFFAPDGSSVVAVTVGEAMDSGDKSTNKAMSAAQKYALFQTFCIPTEESVAISGRPVDSEIDSPEPAPARALDSEPITPAQIKEAQEMARKTCAAKGRAMTAEQIDAALDKKAQAAHGWPLGDLSHAEAEKMLQELERGLISAKAESPEGGGAHA